MSAIGQKQVQRLLQKLSPQQIQMIKLLELPTLQLEQRIKQEIEENPVLEENEKEDKTQEKETKINLDEYVKNEDTPSYKLYANNYSKDDKRGTIPLSDGLSFTDFLQEQLSFKGLDPRKESIGRFMIGSLDSDGYLRRELEYVVDDITFALGMETNEEEVEELLHIIQEFEPTGVGARNLRECLLLQLKYLPQTKTNRIATKIVHNYFPLLAKKHYDKLIQRLGITQEEFKNVIDVIVGLSPKPANLYSEKQVSEPSLQIIPDFILEYNNKKFELSLNSFNIPDVKISGMYVKMMEQMAKDKSVLTPEENAENKDAIQFIKQKIDSARWFISAIKQRNTTLMITMQTILDFQHNFFIDGDETKLRPMILRDIADRTGLDVSTISRVVNSKYIQTHFGIYSLKYFFSEAMQTQTGEEVSSREIKKILSDCVEQEDKRHPLTDEALMIILKEKGYQIARRTVAKYREMLNIPVARLRKGF